MNSATPTLSKTLALAATLLLAAASLSHAAEPEDQIKYRQAVMKALGGHAGATGLLVRGRVEGQDALAMHADALAALSRDLPSLFPEGSDFGETEAKETIWQDWDKFEQAAGKARDATAALAKAVASGDSDGIGAAYREVGQSCKGCHEDFRRKDD